MDSLRFLMTTTFYPPNHIGGDAVFVQYLSEELAKQGHEVHVLSSLDFYQLKTGHRVNKKTTQSNVIVHNLKSPIGILSPLSAYVFGLSSYYTDAFSDLVHQIKPDIVHHHNISLLGHPILRKQGNYKSLHTTHDFWLICPTSGFLTYKGGLCEKKSCALCAIIKRKIPQIWRQSRNFKQAISNLDVIITPSVFFKKILQNNVANKIVSIPNFSPYPPKIIEKSDAKEFFLFAGTLERGKGIEHLISLIKNDKMQMKLFVAGTGSLKSEIEKTIEKHGLANKIVMLGWVDHARMYSLMQNANALIVPSTCFENSPLVALEALSVGTPVIASNNGGLPEILGKVNKALIFNSRTELREIISKFSRSDFPSDRIKQVYADNFSPESHINQYFKVLQDIPE
jgi:glycosyltransferase involved in cell wall biosynthesis